MPSSMSDFIQSFVNLKNVQNQTQQIAQQAQAQAVNGMTTFMELARHTADPGQLTQLVDRFAQLGVGTPDQLGGILQHVTPTAEATRDYLVKIGVDENAGVNTGSTDATKRQAGEAASVATTGMNQGAAAGSSFLHDIFSKVDTHGEVGRVLAQGLASRTATGQTAEQLQQGQDFLNLGQPERTQAAGVAAGTRQSAAQDAGNQLGWANNRLGYASLASNAAYQTGTLEVENAKARAAAQGHDPQVITNLITAKNTLMGELQKAKNPSKQAVMGFIGGLNSINAMMSAYGLPNEGQMNYDPEALVKPGAWDQFMAGPQFMAGNGAPAAAPTSRPTNVRPAGAGRR
jgi:hypothetical protein